MFILKLCLSHARVSGSESLVALTRKRARDNMAGVLLTNNMAILEKISTNASLFISFKRCPAFIFRTARGILTL